MIEQMQPGRELDRLVAEAMGWKLDYEFADFLGAPTVPALRDQYDEWGMLPEFSTDSAAAMEAWAWLEDNYPKTWGQIALMRDSNTNRPCVVRIEWEVQANVSEGDTYPHAIALAIKEAMNK